MNWSKSDIRSARKIPLEPLLRKRGFPLRELQGGNFLVLDRPDLTIRDSFWIWKSKNLQGNSIDFFIHVENLSFSQAMNVLLNHENLKNHSQF